MVSKDSEEFGPVEREDLLGEPFFRLFHEIEVNPAQYESSFEK